MSHATLLTFIVVCALATFATRVIPFLALSRQAEHPLILHLGRYLPPTVMMILVIYALRDFRPLAEGQLNAGANGWPMILAVGLLYTIVSVLGITFWVYLAQKGLHRFNWHRLEHNAGLVSGGILILTGIISFFTH